MVKRDGVQFLVLKVKELIIALENYYTCEWQSERISYSIEAQFYSEKKEVKISNIDRPVELLPFRT